MKKITPTIAKVLAHRIYEELTAIIPPHEKVAKELTNKIRNNPNYKKGLKTLESFKKINAELRKLVEKDLRNHYKPFQVFKEEPINTSIFAYMLENNNNIPCEEQIKDDILLEAFFDTENVDPSTIIEKYVNKYIKKQK